MPANVTIKTRRGTSMQWSSANPVLEAGEPGYETDTGVLKIGDGVTAYNSLDYVGTESFSGSEIDTLLTTVNSSNISATHKITRSATLVIAASDSSAKSKAQADYVCDGTDDQVEIQAAIDALDSTGGIVQLLDGNFYINPTQDVYAGGSKAGMVVDADNIEITGTHSTKLKIVDGINVGTGCAIVFYLNAPTNTYIHNLYFNGNRTNITASFVPAIFYYDAADVKIKDNYFTATKWAIWGDAESASNKYGGIVSDNIFRLDLAGGAVSIHNTPWRTLITNNFIYHPSQGIMLDSCYDCIVSNNIIDAPSFSGIYAYDTVRDCIISNNIISGTSAIADQWGIDFYTDPTGGKIASDRNQITGNKIHGTKNGIRFNGENNVITDNMFSNITDTILSDLSSVNTILKRNIGYLTENTGTATITAPATTVDVTHGLAAAPTRVLLSPTTATAGKQYYVSAKDATTFTITIDTAAGADISFDWQAVI